MSAETGGSGLARLERVDVRKIWSSEASSFTPWLASDENISLLSETIGIDLDVEAQEKAVGLFRADILCKDSATDNWVLIENQLERTDHSHLGQLLTYAAGLDAVTIVWISPAFTEEHRATLDWLNQITDERFNFLGLEIELWRIGDSPIAPKFNIVSKPNNWVKSVAQSAKSIQAGSLTPTKQLQLEYWAAFKELVDVESKILRAQKPLPQHWTSLAIGRSGFHLSALVNTEKKRIGVQLVIDHLASKSYFKVLEQSKADIEVAVGCVLNWKELPQYKESRIEIFREQADPANRKDWPAQQRWLVDTLESFHRTFGPRIRNMAAPEPPIINRMEGELSS
jgi:hypothetical protein